MKNAVSDFSDLDEMKNHPVSNQIDEVFKSVIKETKMEKKPEGAEFVADPGEITLGEMDELDIGLGTADEVPESSPLDEGMELSLSEDENFDIGEIDLSEESGDEQFGDLSLGDDEELSLDGGLELSEEGEDSEGIENLGELDLGEAPDLPVDDDLSLSFSSGADDHLSSGEAEDSAPDESDSGLEIDQDSPSEVFSLGGEDEFNLSQDEEAPSVEDEGLSLDLGQDEELSLSVDEEGASGSSDSDSDLSEDALEKLKEIDAIMEYDASQVHLRENIPQDDSDSDLDEPLVSPDLNLDSLNFSTEEDSTPVATAAPALKEEKKKKKKEDTSVREIGEELKEISGAYSGEMERMQATISNLRADREELLAKIQKLEEEKVLQSRQNLTLRAELDERKIELTIIRKKLNEEINELKDRLKLFEEKRLILEEKNRILQQELDKAAQKNKLDVKKVQMRERELEQKLELLKADAETQIRNRDLKILELKRKIDAMEFDMESMSQQEKRSVESRYELEDKLEKAIKTLRTAITVLEDESDRSNALSALKKNIDM